MEKGHKSLSIFAFQEKFPSDRECYKYLASKANLGSFMRDHIAADALVKKDCWAGYKGMENEFPNLVREKSGKKGGEFWCHAPCY
ncbi:hypothetical protein ADIS_0989 [Lunatimonas lonarensis]|uniref:Transposase n=1 Tax=Lunatimonas lonarensis TaxID=1232681 RepID=R7ZWJ7_9BACT|nr:hypothetical protein [Lunatimonas lonarensis]EON78520.1 hypothetical protein ADIS_0989 [Lunatimonas lonarensis]